MIDHYYKDSFNKAVLREGLLGSYVDPLARWLMEHGYQRDPACRHLRMANYLGRWLAGTGRPLENLDEAQLDRFIEELSELPFVRKGRSRNPKKVRTSALLVLTRLRADGLVHTLPPAPQPVPDLLLAFEAWMVMHKSARTRTLHVGYRVVLRRFLAALGEDPKTWTATAIRAFVLAQVERLGTERVVTRLTPIRSLLRYVGIVGGCSPNLVGAVPRLASWKRASLPRWIQADEVERIIAGCDTATPMGRRDRAALLLMARLGLRAADVGELRLADLDWASARIRVSGKSRREIALPLPQDVGDAVLAYLVEGRPACSFEQVFCGVRAPHRPLGATGIRKVVTRTAGRAGVCLPESGSHVLRHSLATALLAQGVSLAGIGVVLRHTSLDTTRIYAKADLGSLRGVAQPWPVEASS